MRFQPGLVVLALAAIPAFGQTPAPPSPVTERIVMRHMYWADKGDLAAAASEMADPVTIIGGGGARIYTKADLFKRFATVWAKPTHIVLVRKACAGNICNVVYTANPGKPDEHQFQETFFVQDGKIVAYSNTAFDHLYSAKASAPSK